jgi:hypothetical protein
MGRQLPAYVTVNRNDPIKAKSVVDTFLVASTDQVKVCQGMSQRTQMGQIDCFDRQLGSLNELIYREALVLNVEMKSASFALERLKARKILFSEVKQKVKFLFYLNFAFDFVDFCEIPAAFSFNEIVRVNEPFLIPVKDTRSPKANSSAIFAMSFFVSVV